MNSTLILFKEIGRQLLIVGLVLGSLPMAIRILWKLRLLPLGCYFVATKLFWPRWVAAIASLYSSTPPAPAHAWDRLSTMTTPSGPTISAPILTY